MWHKQFVYWIAIALLGASPCFAQKNAVYNMFLEEPIPANGSETYFNAPILRWPFQKGKLSKYELQLSKDPNFQDASSITVKDLESAFYNPHQILDQGKWWWRYRVLDKDWSKPLYFIVNNKAQSMVSPKAEVFLAGVPVGHPRIFAWNSKTNLKQRALLPEALAIVTEAKQALEEKTPSEKDAIASVKGENELQDQKLNQDAVVGLGNRMHKMVLALSQGYLLTENALFQEKAIEIGLEIARWDSKGVTGSSDFMDGVCMYDMAIVFDNFHASLTQEQQKILLDAIHIRAAQFYKSWLNNIDSKVLSGHVWQLLLNEFINTSIAVYKHDPDAAKWLKYGYELFLARSPVLGGIDGGWAEGAYYFHMNMETLVEIPQRIKAYTGFDFMAKHPWYQNNADWLVYHFSPGSSADGFGDNTEELFEPPASYASFASIMGRLTQNPKYTWYAKKLEAIHPNQLATEPILRWFRLVNEANYPEPNPPSKIEWPMGHLTQEVGVAAFHSNLNVPKQDIMIAMRSSSFGAYGHILADQNSFNILYAGKRLFYRTGYKVSMNDPHRLGWSKHTKSMNGMLVNGEGQPYSVEAYGHFSRFLQGQHLAYLKADASNAYQSKETKEDFGVTQFYRHVVMIQEGYIVIYDELAANKPVNWSWLIHSLENMQLDSLGNQFSASIEEAVGKGRLWSSAPINWGITNKFDVPAVLFRNYQGMRTKEYKDTQWHLKATNKTAQDKMRFLVVLQIGKNGTLTNIQTLKTVDGNQKIQIGNWTIEASLSTELAPQLLIQSNKHNTAFSAYGNNLLFKSNTYSGTVEGSSKMVELLNGKMKFVEAKDVPLPVIR